MKLAVLALLLGSAACVASEDVTLPQDDREVALEEVALIEQDHHAELCALASELPEGELCALVCDPDAFKARLVDDGMKTGNCYQVRCTLSPEMSVTVGVCLP